MRSRRPLLFPLACLLGLATGRGPFSDPGSPGSAAWQAFAAGDAPPAVLPPGIAPAARATTAAPASLLLPPPSAPPRSPDRATRLKAKIAAARKVLHRLIRVAKGAADQAHSSAMKSRSLRAKPTLEEDQALSARLEAAKATMAASSAQKAYIDGLLEQLHKNALPDKFEIFLLTHLKKVAKDEELKARAAVAEANRSKGVNIGGGPSIAMSGDTDTDPVVVAQPPPGSENIGNTAGHAVNAIGTSSSSTSSSSNNGAAEESDEGDDDGSGRSPPKQQQGAAGASPAPGKGGDDDEGED